MAQLLLIKWIGLALVTQHILHTGQRIDKVDAILAIEKGV